MRLDFIGGGGSDDDECPAVFVDPNTGDFYQQGRIVTDPETLAQVAQHRVIGADEAVVWQPAEMAEDLRQAATGSYEAKQGEGQPDIETMLRRTQRSAVHMEMREQYRPSPGFDDWIAGGSGRTDRSWWTGLVTDAVRRGVQMRRARIVSEPVSDYIRWEHMVTDVNIEAGEEVRWLPRPQASGIMLPHADFWMFDQKVVRYHYNGGDGTSLKQYEFVSDPRHVSQVVASFEMVWERAIPHADYKV